MRAGYEKIKTWKNKFKRKHTFINDNLSLFVYYQFYMLPLNNKRTKLSLESSFTGCFTDLGKLNLSMVVRFKAPTNFRYCSSCLKKWSMLKKWSKLTQRKSSYCLDLNTWNLCCTIWQSNKRKVFNYYRVFNRFKQARINPYVGSILSSNRFPLLPHCLKNWNLLQKWSKLIRK